MLATMPRSVLKNQNVQGKPCPPGYNNKRDGCIEGDQGHAREHEPEAKLKPQGPMSLGDAHKAKDKLREDKRVFKLPDGTLIRASDIRVKDDLSGTPKFVVVLRQNAHDSNSSLVGKFVDVPAKWVQDWANSSPAAKPKDKPKPISPLENVADRNKPYLPGSVGPKEGLGDRARVDEAKPSKPASKVPTKPKPGSTKKPKEKPKPKANMPAPEVRNSEGYAAKAFDGIQVDPDLLKIAMSGKEKIEAKPFSGVDGQKKYSPKFKRDPNTGKYLKGPDGKKIPVMQDVIGKDGKPTGARKQAREGQLLVDGKPIKLPHKISRKIAGWFRLDMKTREGNTINWTDLKVTDDPNADIWATAKGPVSNKNPKIVSKRLENPAFGHKNRVIKFAKTDEGLRRWHAYMLDQVNKDMASGHDSAVCARVMFDQGTRPGGSDTEKQYEHHWGKALTNKDVVIKPQKVKIGNKAGEIVKDKDGNVQHEVWLKVPNSKTGLEELVLVDKKPTKQEIINRVKSKQPLHDSQYWLRPFGASTMQGRHIIPTKGGGAKIAFIGKELVWQEHEVRDKGLAKALLEHKAKAGDDGPLFPNEEVYSYVKSLDGGIYTPKDLRTMRGTQEALDTMNKIKPPKTYDDYMAKRKQVGELGSKLLGNTPSIFLAKYGSPAVFESWKKSLPKKHRQQVEDWEEEQEAKELLT